MSTKVSTLGFPDAESIIKHSTNDGINRILGLHVDTRVKQHFTFLPKTQLTVPLTAKNKTLSNFVP